MKRSFSPSLPIEFDSILDPSRRKPRFAGSQPISTIVRFIYIYTPSGYGIWGCRGASQLTNRFHAGEMRSGSSLKIRRMRRRRRGWKREREKEGKCFNRRTTTIATTTTTTIARWLFRAAREDKKVERIDWLREDYQRDYLN